jgi:hypothetical protein
MELNAKQLFFIMQQTIQNRLVLLAKEGLIDLPTLKLFFRD